MEIWICLNNFRDKNFYRVISHVLKFLRDHKYLNKVKIKKNVFRNECLIKSVLHLSLYYTCGLVHMCYEPWKGTLEARFDTAILILTLPNKYQFRFKPRPEYPRSLRFKHEKYSELALLWEFNIGSSLLMESCSKYRFQREF